MKKIGYLMVFFFLIPFAIAEDEWLYSDSATIKIDVTSHLTPKISSNNYVFEVLKINLSMIPKNTERQNFSISYFPKPKSQSDDYVNFEVYSLDRFDFGYTAEIKTTNNVKKIKDKIKFPAETPEEIKIYASPTERINSDDETIVKVASKLAEGEDDYYVVVDKIGEFVNKEVNYNLSTLFIKGTKSASWILENKEGVCSEISVLFIAMLRSIGIPARFVSGISYTNSELFDYNFGPHAWAEVYFPNIGWIPYDITYGQFGFIDLGHIEMKKSVDASETSVSYYWKAKNVDVESSEMKIDGEILKKKDSVAKSIEMKAKPYYERVNFLSYNVIIVDITNLKDYYVSKNIRIANTENLELPEREKHIILKPNEKKRIFFTVKTANLDSDFYYTFPIKIYGDQNETAETAFLVGSSWFRLTEDNVFEITSQILGKDSKTYNKNIQFTCFKRDYYLDETISMKCSLKNQGNIYYESLDVCLKTNCQKTSLGISREERMNFTLKPEKTGVLMIPVKITGNGLEENSEINLNILDLPKINIESVEVPDNVSFDEQFEISYTLNKISDSMPKRIIAKIIINNDVHELNIDEIKNKYKVKSTFYGKELTEKSDVALRVEYEDLNGRKYQTEKDFQISLRKATGFQKIRILLNDIIAFIKGLI